MNRAPNDPVFAATRWTLVECSRGRTPEGRAAMRELCAAYYAPVVAFLCRQIGSDDAGRELAHAFFEKVLADEMPFDADRQRGRFRNYLLGAVKHFLLNQKRDARRAKRGGDATPVSIENANDLPDPHALPSDAFFDRQWALAIIERSLDLLQQESRANGDADQFAALRPWISPGGAGRSQAEVAAELGMSEGAVKVAIHRLRARFRTVVRREVAQTLNDPAELEDEMRHLVAALAAR